MLLFVAACQLPAEAEPAGAGAESQEVQARPSRLAESVLAAAPSALANAGLTPQNAGPTPQNVVLISVDTLRADALGFAGNRRSKTPNLDRLASTGWVFENARAHATMTLPSHASMLTGLFPYQHGLRDNVSFTLSSETPTLATTLKANNFATAAFVAAFPLDQRYGLARDFDLYDDAYGERGNAGFEMAERPGSEVVTRALDWWRQNQGKRRFLFVHLYEPHAPYTPASQWAAQYRDNPYLGEVATADSYLEPLLDQLLGAVAEPVPAAEGPEPSTLVVFTSDHGEGLGEHGELTHGVFAYDSTLRVPLVVWKPGLGARRVASQVGHIDIVPTVLDALNLEAPDRLPGRSLFSSISTQREHYFEALEPALNRGWAPLRGTIRARLKYIDLPIPELYDLAQDPKESTNLAQRRAGEVGERARALPAASSWPPTTSGSLSDREAGALRSLGYLTSGGATPIAREFTADDDPKSLIAVDRMIHDFMGAHASRQPDRALRLAREIVEARPSMATAHYLLGMVLLERGDTQQALDAMTKAYRADVTNPPLLRQLALTLAKVGRARPALAVLEPMLELDDPDTLNAFAIIASEAGELERADRSLDRLLAIDPTNPKAHENRALVALKREDWSGCLRASDLALVQDERLPLAWNYRGIALYNLGRRADAVAAWQRAVDLDPADYDLLYNLATVAAEIGQTEIARDFLQRFVTSAPPDRYQADLERARSRLEQLGGGP